MIWLAVLVSYMHILKTNIYNMCVSHRQNQLFICLVQKNRSSLFAGALSLTVFCYNCSNQ